MDMGNVFYHSNIPSLGLDILYVHHIDWWVFRLQFSYSCAQNSLFRSSWGKRSTIRKTFNWQIIKGESGASRKRYYKCIRCWVSEIHRIFWCDSEIQRTTGSKGCDNLEFRIWKSLKQGFKWPQTFISQVKVK